jgi:hypothetical protein
MPTVPEELVIVSGIEPLQYVTGAEGVQSVVVKAATVVADGDGNKVLRSGTLLVKLTDGTGYGPYAAGALDGRQTVKTTPDSVILSGDLDVSDNVDRAQGGYYDGATFKITQLTLNGATVATVRTAFPTCHFV